MTKITKLLGREIYDSRGNPTVEVDLEINGKFLGRASVPSGASTGSNEACELRDGGERLSGKGVLKAVMNVNTILRENIVGKEFKNQKQLDLFLISLDGTENKSKLGANAILGVSMAYSKAMSAYKKIPLFEYFAKIGENKNKFKTPIPMMNILNGGKHADSNVDIQEFMITPVGAKTINEAMEMGVNIYVALKKILKQNNYVTAVGDEGGFAPNLKSNEEALMLVKEAIAKAGYVAGKEICISLDVAATELYKDDKYFFAGEKREFNAKELVSYYADLIKKYPIITIEDGLSEQDYKAWKLLNKELGGKIKLVGDDLYVTNVKLLKKGIKEKLSNAILIKPNQIGTIIETISTVNLAKKAGFVTIMSHRSGETEDSTIADLAVGLGTEFIKTGAPARTDRVCKYNQLIRIQELI